MSSNNTRIAKNTLVLYIRQILTMFIGLYSVRIILRELGVEDYGIYNVIGGVVGLFVFISGTMASATQRFFSYAIGQRDNLMLKKVFSANLVVYLFLSIFVFIMLETIGQWFVTKELIIPQARIASAYKVFHYSSLSFISTFMTAPFISIIIAHEEMKVYAYLSILEAILKLGCVVLLMYSFDDKLVIYSVLLLLLSIVNLFLYIIVCSKRYPECQFNKLYLDRKLFSDILKYTGWTMFGQITSVARTQAITVLVNQVFNPSVVAARAIANSVSIYLSTFSSNFNTGLYPPIIKSYASDNLHEMYKLIFIGSKITFFLMWVFSLPMILKTKYILTIWLTDVPDFAVVFTQLAIVEVLLNSISSPLMTAARAPGKMKLYELSLGIIQILLFGFAWFFLKIGYNAISVYWIAIVANLVMFLVRLIIVNKLIGLSVISFVKKVCLPMIYVVIVSTFITLGLLDILSNSFISNMIFLFTTVIISSLLMFMLGLNKSERSKVKHIIINKINL